MSRMPNIIARNARLPRGFVGWIVAMGMRHHTLPENERAVDLLQIKPGDTVLDIGCGNGTALRLAVDRGASRAVGVDPSIVMLGRARRLSKEYIRNGSVEVLQGEAARLRGIGDRTVTKAMALHTIYFWPDPLAALREIRRTLAPNGYLLVGMNPKDDPTFVENVPLKYYHPRFISEVELLGKDAGFSEVESVLEPANKEKIAWLKMYR